MGDGVRRSIDVTVLALVALSTALQVVALVVRSDAIAEGTTGRQVFSTVEMLLVVLLAWQGWRIIGWARAADRGLLVERTAVWCFVSLVLCGLGDLVNRNYLEQSFQWDDVIRHSYLITAIWFFLPGYAVIIGVNRMVTRSAVSRRFAAATAVVAAAAGALAFAADHVSGMGRYPATMIPVYSMVLGVLAGSTTWLVKAFGWRPSAVVVIGCLLALVADALIGRFWIATDHFPTIEHANWIIYFVSLAMIQQLPFLVAVAVAVADADADAAPLPVA